MSRFLRVYYDPEDCEDFHVIVLQHQEKIERVWVVDPKKIDVSGLDYSDLTHDNFKEAMAKFISEAVERFGLKEIQPYQLNLTNN